MIFTGEAMPKGAASVRRLTSEASKENLPHPPGLPLPSGKESVLHLGLNNKNGGYHLFRRFREFVSKYVHQREPLYKRPNRLIGPFY